jgi:nucleotide-binding universal stress UspA family protein
MRAQVLLCPLTGRPADVRALQLAFLIADKMDAHVRALFVRPNVAAATPYLGDAIGGSVVRDVVAAARQAADEAFAAARTSLEAVAAEAKRKVGDAVSLHECEGYPPDEVAAASRLADLVVFGRDVETMPAPEQTAAERTVMAAGRPIILAPRHRIKSVGSKVAVLWDGSHAAAASVMAGMDFICSAQAVEVIHGAKGKTESDAVAVLEQALALRGVTPTISIVDVAGRDDGAALADAVRAAEADLVVMGAYQHRRIREVLFGGVTRHMLQNGPVPVLFAH